MVSYRRSRIDIEEEDWNSGTVAAAVRWSAVVAEECVGLGFVCGARCAMLGPGWCLLYRTWGSGRWLWAVVMSVWALAVGGLASCHQTSMGHAVLGWPPRATIQAWSCRAWPTELEVRPRHDSV
jgi:hypothetical protein